MTHDDVFSFCTTNDRSNLYFFYSSVVNITKTHAHIEINYVQTLGDSSSRIDDVRKKPKKLKLCSHTRARTQRDTAAFYSR